MLAFLPSTVLGALVVGNGQVQSEAAPFFESSSDSLSIGVDINLGVENTATSCVPAPTSTSGIASPAVTGGLSHMVDVGVGEKTIFVPNQVDASVGDAIVFRFLKFDLTLIQSTLEHPCNPSGEFDAGFRTSKAWNHTNETVTFSVQNPDPVWFFCRQSTTAPHCDAGMLFGLNPAGKMGQFFANTGSSVIGTASDCFPTGSACSYFPTGGSAGSSYFPTGGSAALPVMPLGLTSAPPGVFYTGYAGTGGTGYVGTSAANVVLAFPRLTITSPSASTITSNGITVQTAASSAAKHSVRVILELGFPFLFSVLWAIHN